MANLFYRNTSAQISFEVVDQNNNLVGLTSVATIYWFIKTPDNYIYSNDPNIGISTFVNGIGIYTTQIPVVQQSLGVYYINYTLTKIGDYKYKFQVNDPVAAVNVSSGGDIKVIDDGIF